MEPYSRGKINEFKLSLRQDYPGAKNDKNITKYISWL